VTAVGRRSRRGEARITVTVGGGLVAVGVVMDTEPDLDAITEVIAPEPGDGAAEVESFRDGDRLWVQASVRIDQPERTGSLTPA
jgi:hypothetical protein